jgi:hypothetical protein
MLPSWLRRQWKVISNRRFLRQSSHDLSRCSCKRPDDSSDTGKQEGNAAPIGISPKESKPKPCAQPSREQGQPENPCNQRHGRTFPVRDRSTGTSTPAILSSLALHCKVRFSARCKTDTPMRHNQRPFRKSNSSSPGRNHPSGTFYGVTLESASSFSCRSA